MSRLFKNATLFYQDKFVNTDFMIDDKGILVIADLIDIDEFVIPIEKNNIYDILQPFEKNRGSVKIYWKMFE